MTPLLTLKTRRSSFEGMGEQGRSGVGGQSRGALSLPAAMSACSIFFFLGGGCFWRVFAHTLVSLFVH